MKKYKVLTEIEAGRYCVILPALKDSDGARDAPTHHNTGPLPEKVQTGIDRRYAYVIGMRKAGLTRGNRRLLPEVIEKIAARLKDEKPPSPSTVLSWARRYEDCGQSARALASRNHGRRSPKRTPPILKDLILEKIRTVYLTRDRHSLEHTRHSIVTAAKALAKEGKLDLEQATISKSTLGRWVAELDRYHVIKSRYGSARARLLCRTPMGDDYPTLPFEQIEVDHTPLDWIVICDRTGIPLGRPLLTATICPVTGYVTGLYLSFYGPGLSSVSGVLRNTISLKDEICRIAGTTERWLASGIPDVLVLDNELSFHAVSFSRMAFEVGSDLSFAGVRTPWSKPHIERYFASLGTLTLCSGRIRKKMVNVIDLDPRATAIITFSKLVKGLVQFAVDVFPFNINERKLARPYDLMMEGLSKCPPASYLSNTTSLRMATALTKELTVSQGGVELHGIPFGSSELLPVRKTVGGNFKTMIKWDPDDINQIYIQDPKTLEWICSPSRWPHYTKGLSWNQHLLIRKFLRKQLKEKGAEEQYINASMRLHDFWMDVTTPKGVADAKMAAQFSGVTSARVLNEAKNTPAIAPPQELECAPGKNSPPEKREIPDFDSFVMP